MERDRMYLPLFRILRLLPALALIITLAACAPAPIYKTGAATVDAAPWQVATSPGNFRGSEVVWGGTVVSVHNFPDHSEIEVLGYPLDSSQRPRLKQPATGRFIVLAPGYVEPLDWPSEAPMTAHGTLVGARTGKVGEATYTFPLLKSDGMHRWSAEEMRKGHPDIRIGIGVGVGVGGRIH